MHKKLIDIKQYQPFISFKIFEAVNLDLLHDDYKLDKQGCHTFTKYAYMKYLAINGVSRDRYGRYCLEKKE